MKDSTLRDCPFCEHGGVVREGRRATGIEYFYVECEGCGAEMLGFDDKESAVAHWNNIKPGIWSMDSGMYSPDSSRCEKKCPFLRGEDGPGICLHDDCAMWRGGYYTLMGYEAGHCGLAGRPVGLVRR